MKIIQMTKQAFSNAPLPYKLRGAASEIEQSDITSPGYVALLREAADVIAAQASEIERLEEIINHVYIYWYQPKDSRMDGIEIRKVLQAEVEKRRKVPS